VPVGISQDAAQTVPLMCRTDAASVPNAVHPMNEVAQGVQASIQVGSSNGNNDTQVPVPPKKTKARRVPCSTPSRPAATSVHENEQPFRNGNSVRVIIPTL